MLNRYRAAWRPRITVYRESERAESHSVCRNRGHDRLGGGVQRSTAVAVAVGVDRRRLWARHG
jgi:hypothetical protein